MKLVEDEASPAAVAGLEDVEGSESLLAEPCLPLEAVGVEAEQLVARCPAVEATEAVLQPHQHGVVGVQHPTVLHQHLLQLLHLHVALHSAVQVGLDTEYEVLYLYRGEGCRTLVTPPHLRVLRGQ